MHLLVVDDEPAILQLIEMLVQFSGEHTVTTAECAVDALDVLTQPDAEPVDCFLVDIQMPGTDGIELCKILRSRHDHKKTPILMLTAMSEKSYIDQAFSAGATDYITKPFEIDDLLGCPWCCFNNLSRRRCDRDKCYTAPLFVRTPRRRPLGVCSTEVRVSWITITETMRASATSRQPMSILAGPKPFSGDGKREEKTMEKRRLLHRSTAAYIENRPSQILRYRQAAVFQII